MGQRGALMGKGRTFAVLGSGVDICYPREHMGLYVDILDHGYSLGIRRLCESILIRDKIRQQFNPRSIEAIITLRDCCKLRLKDGRAFLVRLSRDNNLKFRAIDAVGQGG